MESQSCAREVKAGSPAVRLWAVARKRVRLHKEEIRIANLEFRNNDRCSRKKSRNGTFLFIPVAGFASPANLRERGVVAGQAAGLGFVEAGEGHGEMTNDE